MSDKHDVMLDLDINSNAPKSGGFFATDQTPTPTKLYGCEEYGIFEDLKLVNPFDEIFRHAVEEKSSGKVHTTEQKTTQPPSQDEESLHTPQVFPQLEGSTTIAPVAIRQQSTPLITDLVMPEVETGTKVVTSTPTTHVKKYRAIAEKPTLVTAKPIQDLTHPQMLTVNLSDPSTILNNCKGLTTGTAIPIQTVKPLILPKVETKLKPNNQISSGNGICMVTSPSSASLTPTSQLPIKERLKVILNNNSKTQRALVATEAAQKTSNSIRRAHESKSKYDERCMERRRAAATRYRNKMRNEHKELKKRNTELQAENDKLRKRVAELEQHLAQRTTSVAASAASNAQIQIPPSSIHLIMNIPKLLVPANGPPLLHNPITYSVEKK